MSDFSNITETGVTFKNQSESITSDFSDAVDSSVLFSSFGSEAETTFFDVGDGGYILVQSVGFGEGGFGEGGFGGYDLTFAVNANTPWANVDTP